MRNNILTPWDTYFHLDKQFIKEDIFPKNVLDLKFKALTLSDDSLYRKEIIHKKCLRCSIQIYTSNFMIN